MGARGEVAHLLAAGLNKVLASLGRISLGHVGGEVGHRQGVDPLVIVEGAGINEGHGEVDNERLDRGWRLVATRLLELSGHPLGRCRTDLHREACISINGRDTTTFAMHHYMDTCSRHPTVAAPGDSR